MPEQGSPDIPRVGDPQRLRYLAAGLVPHAEMTPDELGANWDTPPSHSIAEAVAGREWPLEGSEGR